MTKLVLIRHGDKETTGLPNPPLSAKGKEQSSKLELKTECVIVSPMRRALQTYVESHISTKRVVVCDLFRELRLSSSCFLELELVDPESDADFTRRVEESVVFLKSLSEQHITVISHEDFLLKLQEQLDVKEPRRLEMAEQLVVQMV
jgi:broad specificity phosphatase PhoE